ncbi:MAG: hypothetical protein ACP5HU_06395 [Phycisphaerae bacterium]
MATKSGQKGQFLAVVAIVFAATAGQITLRGRLAAPTTEYNEQFRMARYLADGEGFVCPVGPPRDDPSSWYTPGYVALMAGVLKVSGGPSSAALATIRLLNTAAFAMAAGLAFLIARRLLDATVAWTTVVLLLISPTLAYKADEIWDTQWTMLAGMSVMFLLVCVRPRRWPAVFAAGLACATAAMINPSFTLCYPVWVAYAGWKTRPEGKSRHDRARHLLRYVLLAATGFVLGILPWTVRNYRTFGELFYLRGNLPLEMWVGNAPWSDGYFFAPDGSRIHPVFDRYEALRMERLGEWEYFRACSRDVARWWNEDPQRFFRLGLRRVRWFWFGRYDFDVSTTAKLIKAVGAAGPSILALFGTAFVVLRRRRALVLVITAAVYPLVYYATIVMVRYRLPVEPVVMMLAALGVVETARLLGRRLRFTQTPHT